MSLPVFSINDAKLTRYLLDLNHKVGGAKAKFFISRGFTKEDPGILGSALIFHAVYNGPYEMILFNYGAKLIIIGGLLCPNGASANVCAVWMIAAGTNVASLVTAYPN